MKSIYLLLLFLVTSLFYSCTDVPLSYNTKILNRNILGHWQEGDSTAFSFLEKDAKAIFQQYEYNPNEDRFVANENPCPVYFRNIKIAGKKHQFISIGLDDSSFVNMGYSFNAAGDLEIKIIDADLPYARKASNTAFRYYFKTSRNLRKYVKEKIGSADFYGPPTLCKPRYNFTSLQKPAKRTVH